MLERVRQCETVYLIMHMVPIESPLFVANLCGTWCTCCIWMDGYAECEYDEKRVSEFLQSVFVRDEAVSFFWIAE